MDDSESSFNLARINLTHTLGTSKDHSEATFSLIFQVMDQGHHKRLQDPLEKDENLLKTIGYFWSDA
jgi:hypothetical protein